MAPITRSNSPTIYTPLDRTKSEIRLLRILPICFGPQPAQEVIECELFTTASDQHPIYEALSYEWGPKMNLLSRFLVRINGCVKEVQENLWWALYHMREDKPRTMWVDALCIDQGDIGERNHQVQQMESIYRNAKSVEVWLGLEEQDPHAGQPSDRATFSFLHEFDARLSKRVSMHSFHDPANPMLEGVDKLFQKSYWHRVWIIQEIILAAELNIHCGTLSAPWSRISAINSPRQSNYQKHWKLKRGGLPIQAIMCGQRLKESIRFPTIELLCRYKNAKCHDARDRIYGMRSMSLVCCQQAVPVDYSLSPSAVLKKAMRHHILRHHFSDLVLERLPEVLGTFNSKLPGTYWIILRLYRNVRRSVCYNPFKRSKKDRGDRWSVAPLPYLGDYASEWGGAFDENELARQDEEIYWGGSRNDTTAWW